jgi:hypothetical protein
VLSRRQKDLQQTQAEHNRHSNLLLFGNMQLRDQFNRKKVCQKVGEDVGGGIGQIERIDINAGLVDDRGIPGSFDRAALKDAHQDIGTGRGGTDSQHDVRGLAQPFVSQTRVEREDRAFDKAQARVVKNGRNVNNLGPCQLLVTPREVLRGAHPRIDNHILGPCLEHDIQVTTRTVCNRYVEC